MDAPSPPPTPNPYAVASSQTSSNISTAVSNTFLQNADEDHPDGVVRYIINGEYVFEDPTQDTNGNVTGSITRVIPRFKRSVSLTAKNQQIKDRQDDVKLEFATLARQQTQQINTTLATPFTLGGVPARGSVPAAPLVNTNAPVAGALVRTIGSASTASDRLQAQDAINNRLQWQIDQDRSTRVTKLECMGIFPGSEAYDRELLVFDRSSNDARIQAYLAASKEMETRQAIEIQKSQFANSVQQQEFQQRTLIIEISNQANLRLFQSLMQLGAYVDAQRATLIQERVLERGQSVNEVSALMHGGKIDMPQFAGFRPGHISDTPVGQYVYQSAALDMQKWQAETQQQQQMMGGLLSLGGALLTAPMTGGGSLLGGMMGGMR